MKSEMPKSLAAIERASDSLMDASTGLKSDPYSQVGRGQTVSCQAVKLSYCPTAKLSDYHTFRLS